MGNKSSQDGSSNKTSSSLFSTFGKCIPSAPEMDDPIVPFVSTGNTKGLDYDINEKLKV